MSRLDQAHSMDMPYDLGHIFHYTLRTAQSVCRQNTDRNTALRFVYGCRCCLAFSNAWTGLQVTGLD